MRRAKNASFFAGLPLMALAAVAVLFTACSNNEASLRAELDKSQSREALLANRVTQLEEQKASYEQIAAAQNSLAHSLQQQLDTTLGDSVSVTEGIYTSLPKTLDEAKAQGYVLMDIMSADGKMVQAQCFSHVDALHYGKPEHSVTTNGVMWHGAPLLAIYSSATGKIMGVVLESTTPQPDSLWEHHLSGHPGMDFEHWSLHFWFTNPPKDL